MLSGDAISECPEELAATHGWVRVEREVRPRTELVGFMYRPDEIFARPWENEGWHWFE